MPKWSSLGMLVMAGLGNAQETAGWKASEQTPSQQDSMHVRVALVQPRLAELEKVFAEVSNPQHANYGKFLNKEQIKDLVQLPAEQRDLVQQQLGCGASVACQFSVHNDFIELEASVERMQDLFQVPLRRFEAVDAASNRTLGLWRAEAAASIPAPIRHLVHSVQGVHGLPPVGRHRMASVKSGKEPGSDVDPSVITSLYNITGKARGLGGMACAEFEGEEFQQSDVDAFTARYSLAAQQVDVVGSNDGGYSGEGILDLEYLIGVAPGIQATYWSIAWTSFGNDLLNWTLAVQAAPNPPLVHSISWGSGEQGATYDMPMLTRTNTEFMKMGAAGLSVLTASGDDGTGSTGFGCKKFDPSWPASTPYATAVGGTYLDSTGEVGWKDSGGGFSNLFPMPAYQRAAVKAYMAQPGHGLPAASKWNATGRAIPDVAALATNYQVINRGGMASESGTSAAAPVFAGMIALVNDARLAAGKSPLGFLNPALYQLGQVGTDITSGNNKKSGCSEGFPARPGWDPVTGLGTPLYANLMGLA